MKHRVLIGGLVTAAVLLLAVVVVYAFGTPQAPTPAAQVANNAIAEAPTAASPVQPGESSPATGEAPPPDPSSPLAIEIPGCVCHSDDPKLVEEHASYRMNQCFGCHAGGMPEMGQ